MKQLSAGGNWQLADARVAQYHAAIRKILMADQLQPQDGRRHDRDRGARARGLIRQLLGPIYGRLQPSTWRRWSSAASLMYRAGVFGMAPESLGGQNLKVWYNNPLARAQKQEDVPPSSA